MLTVCLAMVKLPVRGAPVFAVTVKDTVPVPSPLAPELIVIQGTALEALHAQSLVVDTVTLPFPPATINDKDPGETE